jgi:hypothetical protein
MNPPTITRQQQDQLLQIRSLFKSWNEHIPAKHLEALYQSLNAEDWAQASAIAQQLDPYLDAFKHGDSEGQFIHQFWQELKADISAQPIQIPIQIQF